MEDWEKTIWLGTFQNGYKRLLINSGSQLKIQNKTTPHLKKKSSVKCFLEDRSKQLWIGTSDDGLYCLAPKRDSYQHYTSKNTPLASPLITALYEASDSTIWLGSHATLLKYVSSKKQFTRVLNNTTPFLQITSITETEKHHIWAGSKQGLWHINEIQKDTTHYTQADGLPSNIVNALLYDESGYLWIATDQGLSQMKLHSKTFRNFGEGDGILGKEFNENAALKASDGKFYFGCTNGVYSFYPNQIKMNTMIPPVVLTNFKLFNKEVNMDDPNSPLNKPINQTEQLILTNEQNVFTIEFVALNFTNSKKNQYAYILEGFEKNWNNIGSQLITR